jgi:hypothetical protein
MNKKTERIAIIGLAAFLVGMFCYQVAYGISASKWGYTSGLKDGKGNVRDSTDTCGDGIFNSTSDYNTCLHAYNLGFKKGCDIEATHPSEPNPEQATCQEYFTSLSLGNH